MPASNRWVCSEPSEVGGRVPLDRPLRKQAANNMAFPHPKSRQHHGGKKDVSRGKGVIGKLIERAEDVAEDRDDQDQVKRAPNRTFGGLFHGGSFQRLAFAVFKSTAARISALNAFSLILPPSWKSIARLTFPSRLELN